MGRETLSHNLLEMGENLLAISRTVPIQRRECEQLAKLLMGLRPFVEQMQEVPMSELTTDALRGLQRLMNKFRIVMTELKACSKVKLLFQNTKLTKDLRDVTSELQQQLSSLPLTQVQISKELIKEKDGVLSELADLREKLQKTNSMLKDQQDFANEVAVVLRDHNIATAASSSSGGNTNVIDRLMGWLASRFGSSVEAVCKEWEDLKEEALSLRVQYELNAESKVEWEANFLHTMVYIDSEQRHGQCATCSSKTLSQREEGEPSTGSIRSEDEAKPPEEYSCPICLNLMENPVITSSGCSFCRSCISKWFDDQDSCPITREKLERNVVIDNIALRNLISRWKEKAPIRDDEVEDIVEDGPTVSASVSSSFEHSIGNEIEEHVRPPLKMSGQSPVSTSHQSAAGFLEVKKHISDLSFHRTAQVLKSLKQLQSIAMTPEGQFQIFEAGGIPAVSRLLSRKDSAVAGKAAGVLEALTFDIKMPDKNSVLSPEERDHIFLAVVDGALEDLLQLLHNGPSYGCRVNAAETLVNILVDEEIRAEVMLRHGIVSAFYQLFRDSVMTLSPSDSKSVCVRAVSLLAGEKVAGSRDEEPALTAALTVALLSLAKVDSHIMEESLGALRLLVEDEREMICNILKQHIPFLVRHLSHCNRSSRDDVLKILNEMSHIAGCSQIIAQYLLKDTNHLGANSNEATTQLLNTCLSSVREDISQVLSEEDLVGLVGLLGTGGTSDDSKVDILSHLQYLCERDNFRKAFLNCSGIPTLQTLQEKAGIATVRDGLAHLLLILTSSSSYRKQVYDQGGLKLLGQLLGLEESLECRCKSVMAAQNLMTGLEGVVVPSDPFPLDSLVDLVGPSPSKDVKYREAAVTVLSMLAPAMWDERVIEPLLDMVTANDLSESARTRAANTLFRVASVNMALYKHFLSGLSVLVDFWQARGPRSRSTIVQMLTNFCGAADDDYKEAVLDGKCIAVLLDAVQRRDLKEESAVALGHLAAFVPARKALLDGGFLRIAVQCIESDSSSPCSVELTRALEAIVDKQAEAAAVRDLGGIPALVGLMKGNNERVITLLVTRVLTKLVQLDPESSRFLAESGTIHLLCEGLQSESSTSLDQVEVIKLLASCSKDQGNKKEIIRGVPPLISIVSKGTAAEKELALEVLLNLSREKDHLVVSALVNRECCKCLLNIVDDVREESSAMEKAAFLSISIIRNLTISGVPARAEFMREGHRAVCALVARIHHHDAVVSPDVIRASVVALERFTAIPEGRLALINFGGVDAIAKVLLSPASSGQTKGFGLKILLMLTEDRQVSRDACEKVSKAGFIEHLKDMLEFMPNNEADQSPIECRNLACSLLERLLQEGHSRSAVCTAVREGQFITKLLELSNSGQAEATTVLGLLKKYDKQSRKEITRDTSRSNGSWSFRSG